jgi:hypothetical protein
MKTETQLASRSDPRWSVGLLKQAGNDHAAFEASRDRKQRGLLASADFDSSAKHHRGLHYFQKAAAHLTSAAGGAHGR